MALLTETTLKIIYDAERIEDLATSYDANTGQQEYSVSVVTTIIAQAQAAVYNALISHYTTTQIDADNDCIRIAADIAMYYLEKRRGKISDGVSESYKLALELLTEFSNGNRSLSAVGQLLPSGETTDESYVDNSEHFDGLQLEENE